MAEQVVIQVWCDPCLTDDEKTEARPFIQDGIRVDLCPAHAKPVVEALEVFATYGRKDKAREKPQKAPRAASGDMACPECGDKYVGPQGLGAHRRAAHGVVGTYSRDKADLDHIATGRIRTA